MFVYQSHQRLLGLIISLCIFISLPLLADLSITEELLDKIEAKYNKFSRQRVTLWQELVSTSDNLTDIEKLELVNKFFNSNVLFIDDQSLWGKEDYWATPLEMLSIGAGDCEDYSIAKYFTLKELGMDEEKLRLTYVKAIDINQAHMVLTYFENKRAIPLVLDNLIVEIKPANLRTDLIPVYSFNGTGLWLAKSRGGSQRVGDASRLSLWEELESRMKNNIQP
ncbi:MAG: sulfate adenylyltransferase [Gammaproteobacteria bacterium]|nr:MAG: sulfate adenylyltransferase [Gammaproteobacteria bacterium]RKZ94534.1 MAG: sulfate adenylyltransferase [Gammaproteobacteria bacterium]